MDNRFDCDIYSEDRSRMNRTLMVWLLLALAAILLLVWVLWPKNPRSITITSLEGEAVVSHVDGTQSPAYEGSVIFSGERLLTTSGQADLRLDDDKHICVEPSTDVGFGLDGTAMRSQTSLSLSTGAVSTSLESPLDFGEVYEVTTDNAHLSASGQNFRISAYTGDDGLEYTRTVVLDGKVNCTPTDAQGIPYNESHNVSAGKEVLCYLDTYSNQPGFVLSNSVGSRFNTDIGDYSRDIDLFSLPVYYLDKIYGDINSGQNYWFIEEDTLAMAMLGNSLFDPVEPTMSNGLSETDTYLAMDTPELSDEYDEEDDDDEPILETESDPVAEIDPEVEPEIEAEEDSPSEALEDKDREDSKPASSNPSPSRPYISPAPSTPSSNMAESLPFAPSSGGSGIVIIPSSATPSGTPSQAEISPATTASAPVQSEVPSDSIDSLPSVPVQSETPASTAPSQSAPPGIVIIGTGDEIPF